MLLATIDAAEVWDFSRNERIVSRRHSRPEKVDRTIQALDGGGLLLVDTQAKKSAVTFWNPATGESRRLAADLSLGPRAIDVSRDLEKVLYIDAFDRPRIRLASASAPAPHSTAELYSEACRRLKSQPEFAVVWQDCQAAPVP